MLKREADSNREVYESLLNQTKETGIAGERRATNVRVIDPAELPRGPISPNIRADMTFALVAGLVLAIGLAFGFEYLDNRIKTPQELKAHLGIPFLGMVPIVPTDKDPNPLMDKSALPQNFAEAFKSIRTNVLFSSAEEGTRSIVVTSAGPGEGKSVVASNLAMALAQAGQRVLLIDADMRRPRVHEIFGGDQEPGLSNALSGQRQGQRRDPQVRHRWTVADARRAHPAEPGGASGITSLHRLHQVAQPALRLGRARYAARHGRRRQLHRREPVFGRRLRRPGRPYQPSRGEGGGGTARGRQCASHWLRAEQGRPDSQPVLLLGVLPQGLREVLRGRRREPVQVANPTPNSNSKLQCMPKGLAGRWKSEAQRLGAR